LLPLPILLAIERSIRWLKQFGRRGAFFCEEMLIALKIRNISLFPTVVLFNHRHEHFYFILVGVAHKVVFLICLELL
jgi:hypothetical protein